MTVLPFGRPLVGDEEEAALLAAFRAGDLATGTVIRRFEAAFGRAFGYDECVAVASGSMANLVALLALREMGRLAPGDLVAVCGATFVTAASPVVHAGMVPVFVDTADGDVNMSLAALDRACRDHHVKAAIVPHTLGQPLDLDGLDAIRSEHSLALVEDCCESLGARWRGRFVGTVGDMATFSFYAGHHLTTGEGGMITTASSALAAVVRSIRAFGRDVTYEGPRFGGSPVSDCVLPDERYTYVRLGLNAKMTDLQAAIGVEQVTRAPQVFAARRRTAGAVVGAIDAFVTVLGSPLAEGAEPFGIAFVPRDQPVERARALEAAGVEVRSFLGASLPSQPCFRSVDHVVAQPYGNAERLGREALVVGCPPVFDEERAVAALRSVLG